MMNYPCTLVLMDADRIKEYIFAGHRLKEIRGASLLLDQLNRSKSRDLLRHHGGTEVFIGGGGVLATFDDEMHAEAFRRDVEHMYAQATEIATITGVIERVEDANDEKDAVRRARAALRLGKANRPESGPLFSSSFVRICSSCNRYPVHAVIASDALCAACVKKRHAAQMEPESKDEAKAAREIFPDYTAYAKFAQRAATARQDNRWRGLTHVPGQLERLEGEETSYIGLIHADVNGLGLYLEQHHSLDQIRDIGHKVEEALELALLDAVRDVQLVPQDGRWPFLIIMMGGDDLMLIVPAKKAVQLAHRVVLRFEEQMIRLLGRATEPAPLALSAGVVISKPKHPAYMLADIAEELTKSAKKLSHQLSEGHPKPSVDFHILHTSTANPIEMIRAQEYTWPNRAGKNYSFTMRPYPARAVDWHAGLDTLIAVILKLRKNDFPRNKLHQWADLIYMSELEQILEWETLYSRVSGSHLDALGSVVQEFHLNHQSIFTEQSNRTELATPLLDLLELYDFVAPIPNQLDIEQQSSV